MPNRAREGGVMGEVDRKAARAPWTPRTHDWTLLDSGNWVRPTRDGSSNHLVSNTLDDPELAMRAADDADDLLNARELLDRCEAVLRQLSYAERGEEDWEAASELLTLLEAPDHA